MSKHTPGPWKISSDGFIERDIETTYDTYEDAIVNDYKGCGTHECEWVNEADKALVSSAPELFESLKDLVNLCENTLSSPVLDRAKVVIQKAKGK